MWPVFVATTSIRLECRPLTTCGGIPHPERWQVLTTRRWVNRFAANADGAGVCVLDGQTRPTFVHSAAEAAGIVSHASSCWSVRRMCAMRGL